jgi:hypothetical protein
MISSLLYGLVIVRDTLSKLKILGGIVEMKKGIK